MIHSTFWRSPFVAFAAILLLAQINFGAAPKPVELGLKDVLKARRILFLGDSITYGGEYVEFVEAYLRMAYPQFKGEILDLGLPSETVSGLTEPGHAGGSFPRPDLHERLSRVLKKTKPDLIFACYGMNDGIYYPFSEERFSKFQDGILRLRSRAAASKASLIILTPPTFDALPIKDHALPAGLAEYRQPYEGYNRVLDHYSEWLLSQRTNGWAVIDVHGPMNRFLAEQRHDRPNFVLAGDGVHVNTQGNWLIAREILRYFGAPENITASDNSSELLKLNKNGKEILSLVQNRQRLLKDSWLTETRHLRPGMNKGKPMEEAQKEAKEIELRLQSLTSH
jgi:lysophospholipase L1-like esterase